MTIDPAVREAAHHFGGESTTFPKLIQAVVRAEGNILAAVRCSLPEIATIDDALDVTCRSAVHAMSDWIAADPARTKAFVIEWAKRWAPVGAANDSHGLNANWPGNVTKFWTT